jgi:hypothetical protein
MKLKVYDGITNRIIDSSAYQAIDKLESLKKKNDLWGVIKMCFKIWADKEPKQYRSWIVETGDARGAQNNAFGSSRSKSMRRVLDIPQDIIFMLRKMYTVEELPMDKKFIEQLWRRFPVFRVAKKY